IQEPFNRYYGLECIDASFKNLTNKDRSRKTEQALEHLMQCKKAKYNITSVTAKTKRMEKRNELIDEMIKNFSYHTIQKYLGNLLFRSESQLRFNLLKYTPGINKILLKDPEAAFASQFLHQQYNMDVVILVRHPLSFAGSLKRLG